MTTLSSSVVKALQVRPGTEPVRLGAAPEALWPAAEGPPQAVLDAAAEIISRAKDEAQAILEEAVENRSRLAAEAHDEGYREGIAQGVEEGRQKIQAQWTRVQEETRAVFDRIARLKQYADLLEPELVLAQAAALSAKLFARQAQDDPAALREYLSALIDGVGEADVTLFLSPAFEATLSSLTRDWGGPWQHVRLAVDRLLENFECRAQGESGQSLLGGPVATLTAILDEVLYGDHLAD